MKLKTTQTVKPLGKTNQWTNLFGKSSGEVNDKVNVKTVEPNKTDNLDTALKNRSHSGNRLMSGQKYKRYFTTLYNNFCPANDQSSKMWNDRDLTSPSTDSLPTWIEQLIQIWARMEHMWRWLDKLPTKFIYKKRVQIRGANNHLSLQSKAWVNLNRT